MHVNADPLITGIITGTTCTRTRTCTHARDPQTHTRYTGTHIRHDARMPTYLLETHDLPHETYIVHARLFPLC